MSSLLLQEKNLLMVEKMKEIKALIGRNVKLFFKDKGLFFTSLITPLILLVLYATFLRNVYMDSLEQIVFPNGEEATGAFKDALNGLVSGQLISSLLAVCCVTVAFCSNMLMVQDKVNGTRIDLNMAPVKSWKLSIAYFIASLFVTLIICYIALVVGLIYVAASGWFMSALDVVLLCLDVLLLVVFGTALSSVIHYFLSTQGQISAVGTIVSSCYGFLSGAYMPISSFGTTLQNVLGFSPGTYGTSLVRNHAMGGAISELESLGMSGQAVSVLKDLVDCNVYFFDTHVKIPYMYIILISVDVLLCVLYVLINTKQRKRKG